MKEIMIYAEKDLNKHVKGEEPLEGLWESRYDNGALEGVLPSVKKIRRSYMEKYGIDFGLVALLDSDKTSKKIVLEDAAVDKVYTNFGEWVDGYVSRVKKVTPDKLNEYMGNIDILFDSKKSKKKRVNALEEILKLLFVFERFFQDDFCAKTIDKFEDETSAKLFSRFQIVGLIILAKIKKEPLYDFMQGKFKSELVSKAKKGARACIKKSFDEQFNVIVGNWKKGTDVLVRENGVAGISV